MIVATLVTKVEINIFPDGARCKYIGGTRTQTLVSVC